MSKEDYFVTLTTNDLRKLARLLYDSMHTLNRVCILGYSLEIEDWIHAIVKEQYAWVVLMEEILGEQIRDE